MTLATILLFLQVNSTAIATVALLIEEAIANIPSIKANSILSLIFNIGASVLTSIAKPPTDPPSPSSH